MSSFPGHTRQILQYAIMTVYGKFAIFVAKITSIFRLLKGIMKNWTHKSRYIIQHHWKPF